MKKFLLTIAMILLAFCGWSQSRCAGKTKAGTACKLNAREGSTYCGIHNPDRVKCAGKKADGNPCGLSPKKGEQYCRFHKP